METDLDSEKNNADDNSIKALVSSDVENKNDSEQSVDIFGDSVAKQSKESRFLTTITAQDHPASGSLEVEYYWSSDFTRFSCSAKRYRVVAGIAWGRGGELELTSSTTDRTSMPPGTVDGAWHNTSESGSVEAGATATIKWTFNLEVKYYGDRKLVGTATVRPSVPVPAINPVNYPVPPTFSVTGTGGVPNTGTITLHNASGDAVLANATIRSNGDWSADVTFPVGISSLSFYAIQKRFDIASGRSNQITVLADTPAVITLPRSNQKVRIEQLIFEGTCAPDAIIVVVKANDHNSKLSQSKIEPSGNWRHSLLSGVFLPSGPLAIKAQYKNANLPDRYSQPVTCTLESFPIISPPAGGSEQDGSFTVTGTGGVVGATVFIYRDLQSSPSYGSKPVTNTNGSWSVTVNVPPGPISLVAEQVLGSVNSGRGTPRAFKIRPPALAAVTVTQLETTVKFSGSGHTGATVEIRKVSGPTATMPAAVVVAGGKWEATATNWPFGLFELTAIQKVSDNTGGWIESQPYAFTVNRVFPDPSDVTYTTDYQPTFSGKGYTGATVKLLDSADGPAVAPEMRVNNGLWSSKAAAVWGPTFEREIYIKQYLEGQASPNWVKLKVTIAPLAPAIDDIPAGEVAPLIQGTCWSGAVVKLKYSDSATEYPASVTGGRWTHRRESPAFVPATHTVTVTQTAAQQTSLPASKPFTIFKPIPKPTINPLEAEVGRDLIVSGGNGMKDATMQLRDAQFDKPLGDPQPLTRDGPWSIELKGLDFRPYTIDAQQSFENRKSERSEQRSFTVVLLPPAFVVPQPGANLPRSSQLSGIGMPGGRVDVWRQGASEPLLKNISVDPDGRWKAEVTLPIGVTTILAMQFFADQTSKDSPPLTYNVVPAAPFIETPATGEHIGQRAVVSGFGVPGDTVTVKLGGVDLGNSQVLEDRTWSVPVTLVRPGGEYGLVAVASCDGFESSDSTPRPVVLGTYQPSIDVPTAGRWVNNPVGFQGQGRPGVGQVVSWFNPDLVWSANLAVSPNGWQGRAGQPLPVGGNWCRFKQTITGAENHSDWIESERFEVQLPPTE